MRRFALLALLFLCAGYAQAQSSFIIPVNSATTGRGIAGAFVRLTCLSGGCGSSTYSATTDTAGNAQFTNAIAGRYTVAVSGSNITTYTYTLDVAAPPAAIVVDVNTYGSRMGTGLNAAYALCPVSASVGGSACPITVPPNPTGACWTLDVPALFTVSGKIADVSLAGSCIASANTSSGNDYVFDDMPNSGTLSFVPQHGMHDGTLINNGCTTNGGCGSSRTAIANGTTNYGAQLGEFYDLKIEGYGTPFANANENAWGETLYHNTFTHNSGGVSISGASEMTKFIDNHFLSNAIDVDISANAEVSFNLNHFDQATTCSINTHSTVARLTFLGNRFENLNIPGNVCYSEGANANYSFSGDFAEDDHGVGASSTSWFTGGFFNGNITLSSGGRNTNPNFLFSVTNQSNLTVFVSTPGTLDAQHIAFQGAGSCLQVLNSGSLLLPPLCGSAPTISSGFGTSPSIVNQYGAASFEVNVGTGGSATSGVIQLNPNAAPNGWSCTAVDMSTNIVTRETAFSTTTVTLTAASAWTASDKLLVNCGAF